MMSWLARQDGYDPNAFDVPGEQSTNVPGALLNAGNWFLKQAAKPEAEAQQDVRNVMGALAAPVMVPGQMMKPNPYPPGSEEAAFYDASKIAKGLDWAPEMSLNMMGGGVAGTGAKASEVALTAGYDPALWHGVSTIKLPKPVSEMTSVLSPVNPAAEKVISPARLQNSMLMPLLGDRTASAAMLERVNGFPFETAVPLQGGHGYMANNPEMAWAAGKSIAPGIAKVAREGAETGLPVHGVYTAMGERSADFSHMVSDTLAEMAKHTKITPEGAQIFNETMKKVAPDFPGVLAPNVAEYLRGAPGELRNTFAKTMDTSKFQKFGFPSVAEARVAVTDPRLLNEPTGASGLSIARMDPKGTLGPSGHATYDTGIAGNYIGGLPASVPKEIMWPDVVMPLTKHADAVAAARDAAGLRPFRPTEDYLMGRVPKGLPKMQMANQEWVDKVSQHLVDRGFTLGSGAIDKKAAAALQATGGIRAYHSSPHDFDKFDLAKIGSGEGAQVYGHGLYFAENPAVSGRGGQYWQQFLPRTTNVFERDAAKMLEQYGFDRAAAVQGVDATIDRLMKKKATSGLSTYDHELLADVQKRRELLASDKQIGPRTYEVNINADPAHMLDWDKALREQAIASKLPGSFLDAAKQEAYQRALASTSKSRADDLWRMVKDPLEAPGGFAVEAGKKTPAVSAALREAGIPGIKYLDQGSRPLSFNTQHAANLDAQAGKLRRWLQDNPADTAAQAKLAVLEKAAQQYQPSYNYVVFDPNLIRIDKKYAVPGALTAGGMGALAAQDEYRGAY